MKKNIFLCGLMFTFQPIFSQDISIEIVLKNKIILCTGPAYGKKQELIESTLKDLKHITFKKIFVLTNDQSILDVQFDCPCSSFYFDARGKQLDCLNSIIYSIIKVAADEQCLDDDIILFKHESVYINDMNLVVKAIEKIMQGYDIVSKYWLGLDRKNGLNFDDYYHTDSFFLSVRAARELSKELQEIISFTDDYRFCEEYFTKYIVNKLSKVYKIEYHHSSWKDNELGLYHIPRFEENPEWYWDKKNYETIY